jgi:L-fucose isomerase-like protein
MIDQAIKPKIGLVTVASKAESGGNRGGELIQNSTLQLDHAGLVVISPGFIVWGARDAERAVQYLKGSGIDLLLILHCTWVMDSIQFQLIKELDVPVMLWGLPYPETFSLASIQHFNSVLHQNKHFSQWVYGLPDETCVIEKIARLARASQAAKKFRPVSIGLVGQHSTKRTAGPQDTAFDEWELGHTMGIKIVHIEMDDFLSEVNSVIDEDAWAVVERMKETSRYGEMKVEEKRILHSAKVYRATKKIMTDYTLVGAAVECYPYYGGLVNLASSWLADEGIVLDPEGDIGHTMLAGLLNALQPGPTALAEMMLLDWDKDKFYLRHEGSTAFSLAMDPQKVEVVAAGEGVGTIVQFPMRPIPTVTVASLRGRSNSYSVFRGLLSIEKLDQQQWQQWGGNFQVAAKTAEGLDVLLNNVFINGMDHHWLIKEGDIVQLLDTVTDIWGLSKFSLNQR